MARSFRHRSRQHPEPLRVLHRGASLVSPDWTAPALLVAAGPCIAMPFVLALQYRINAATIARTMVYSTLISLVTLAFMA